MKAQHSPGPFELNGDGAIVAQLGSKRTGFHLVTAPLTNALEPIAPEVVEANAHLLKAAPQLLSALEQLLDYLQPVPPCDPGCACVFDAAHQAIAAAKGGAK